ncbi:MAG: DsbA family protein [Halobacteriovoraceae bacterium]|nr:DsbA family protein [Halobacteriovoraceae bacterium]
MKKTKFLLVLPLAIMAIFSCTKEVVSQTKYIFKGPSTNKLVAKSKTFQINEAEFYKDIRSDIYEAEMKVFEIKMNRLKSLVLEKLVMNDPQRKNMTNDQFMDEFIAKGISVKPSDIDDFVKERKIPSTHLNEQMKERIKSFLELEKKKEAVEKWVAQKVGDAGIEVFLDEPQRPIFKVDAGNAPFLGDKDAKVTIVEFSDFQCPFCQKGAEIMTEIKKKYGNKVKIVFKNFPLPFHNNALIAAQSALCAHEQDSKNFWKMHDVMFADQAKLSESDLKESAKKLALDMTKFESCLSSKKYEKQVQMDMEEGKNIGVKSTPTFFVNGKLINGAHPVEVFSELIDQEL